MTRIVEVAWSLSYEVFFYAAAAGLLLGTGMTAMPPARRIHVLLLTGRFVALSSVGIEHFPVRTLPFFAGMLLAEDLGSAGGGLRGLRGARPV